MPRFTKGVLPSEGGTSFDSTRTLQVIQIGRKTSIYLFDGDGANVQVAQDAAQPGDSVVGLEEVGAEKLLPREKAGRLRKFVLKGTGLGTATVTAESTVPLQVVVAKNADGRIFDGSGDVLPQKVVTPLKAYGLRGAAIRIAEDQMASSIGRTSGKGAGMYMEGSDEKGRLYDWCGGFVQWCYQNAAAATGLTNPFGNTAWALASPQRAISWGMAHPGDASVIQYSGSNPMDPGKLYGVKGSRAETQSMIDIGYAAHGNPSNVIEGDICLQRKDDGSWKHVCMVYNISGSTFDTMNGNPSIWIDRGLKFSDRVGKDYRYAFLHLSLPPVDWISGWTAESRNGSSPVQPLPSGGDWRFGL